MIKTGIRKTLDGHQAWFTIGNQTFHLEPQEDDEYIKDGVKKVWTSKKAAKWYQMMLDKAFEKVIVLDNSIKECPKCNGTNITVHHMIRCADCKAINKTI